VRALLERHARASQRLDQGAGLGVRAIEHGEIGKRETTLRGRSDAAAVHRKKRRSTDELLDRVHDEFRFGLVGRRVVGDDPCFVGHVRDKATLVHQRCRRDRLQRGVDNGARRAVVAGQVHNHGGWIVVREALEDTHVRPAKTVDGLVGVADGAEVRTRRCEEPNETILQGVDVLILVDRYPAVPFPVGGAELVVRLEEPQRQRDQIVEVQPSPFAQSCGIEVCFFGQGCVRTLRLGDPAHQAAGGAVAHVRLLLEQCLPFFVIGNPHARRQIERLSLFADDTVAQGVKCRHRHGRSSFGDEPGQALGHFAGRAVCERNRQA